MPLLTLRAFLNYKVGLGTPQCSDWAFIDAGFRARRFVSMDGWKPYPEGIILELLATVNPCSLVE